MSKRHQEIEMNPYQIKDNDAKETTVTKIKVSKRWKNVLLWIYHLVLLGLVIGIIVSSKINYDELDRTVHALDDNIDDLNGSINAFNGDLKHISSDLTYLDENLDEFNGSLNDISADQKSFNEALSKLSEEINSVSANASCEEIGKLNVTEDGYYMIQPSLDLASFKVRCKFNKIINKAYTILEPEHSQSNFITATPNGDDGCGDPGCFIDKMTYAATKKQIEALMKISTECTQSIEHHCYFNAITNFAWWIDRNGNKIEYWNGDLNPAAKGCKCAQSANCENDFGPAGLCNCDNRSISSDSGILTSMAQLPVMQLNYGDSEYSHSWIEYDLGPLKCSGKEYFYPSEIKSASFMFKAAFNPLADQMSVIKQGEPLQFSNTIIDDTLDSLLTDGNIFKAYVAGLYKFSLFLSLDVSNGYGFEIDAQVNGQTMQRFSKNSNEQEFLRFETFEFHFELILSENDILSLRTTSSKLEHNNFGNCKTESLQHTCSFITGALIERIH